MNIEQLKSIASYHEDFEKTAIEYLPYGNKEPVSFDVFIKKQPSVDDFEAINGLKKGQDSTFLTEQVVRCVRLGENGEEALTKEMVQSLDCRLVIALANAVREVQDKEAPKKGGWYHLMTSFGVSLL